MTTPNMNYLFIMGIKVKRKTGKKKKKLLKKTKKLQEVKLKWFQFRLLHRSLATNIVLKEMDIAPDVLCNFCNLERDFCIQNSMWRCQHVKLLWNKLEEFNCDHCNNVHNFKFIETIIMFETDDNFKSDNALDCIILYSIVPDMKITNLSYVYLGELIF